MVCQRGAFTLLYIKPKHCYGNTNIKGTLYSLSFDIYRMYLFSVAEKKPSDPEL